MEASMATLAPRTFYGLLQNGWKRSLICVGLDPDLDLFPAHLKKKHTCDIGAMIEDFNSQIIDATKEYVCAYKMNWAQYLAYGTVGVHALQRTIERIRIYAPDAVVILDAKPGDGDNTNKFYVRAAFDELKADAVTVNPYMGGYETFAPFLERKDKGVIFLCKSSNPDSGVIQDLKVGKDTVYMKVAKNVMAWNKNANCGLVVGATHPTALEKIRRYIGNSMPILSPGVGRQGGDAELAVRVGKDAFGTGIFISSSTGVTYASKGEDFAEKAKVNLLQLVAETASGLTTPRRRPAKQK